MRLRKLVFAVSLLQVCFMLGVQSAKADTIVFNDNPGEPTTVSTTGRVTQNGVVNNSCAETVVPCVFTVDRPGFIIAAFGIVRTFSLAESRTTVLLVPISDTLDSSQISNTVQFTFNSDLPAVGGAPEGNLGPCPINGGCSAVENGTAQALTCVNPTDPTACLNGTAGEIVWFNPTSLTFVVDTISVNSDIAEAPGPTVPEPASLILFGSGLAIAGGFLRRRRRLVTPSA